MLLVGLVIADIVHRFNEYGDIARALKPIAGFVSSPWWEVAKRAEEYTGSQADFSAYLHKQCEDGLRDLIRIFPESANQELARVFSIDFLSRLLGSFELNNFGVRVAHPAQLYVQQMLASPDAHLQAEAAECLGKIVDRLEAEDEDEEEEEDDDNDDGTENGDGYGQRGEKGGAPREHWQQREHGELDEESIFGVAGSMEGLELEEKDTQRGGMPLEQEEQGVQEEQDKQEEYEPWELDTFVEYGDDIFPPLDAVAAFKVLALINHSCAPNVKVEYRCEGRKALRATLVALRDISEGEELFHCYCTDANLPRAERRDQLSSYGFECACLKCTQGK
jgi:hypothetical protein